MKKFKIVFESKVDLELFALEENLEINLDKFTDNHLNIEVDEGLLLRRDHKKKTLKSYRKSKLMKKQWRLNRKKFLKPIKKFHKSTKGKRFHRKLGKLLATRTLVTKRDILECLISVQSFKTHLNISNRYFSSSDNEVDFEIFTESLSDILNKLEFRLNESFNNGENFEFTNEDIEVLDDLLKDENEK